MSEFEYMLLGRLRDDCEYWLGYGDRYDKYLWAGSPQRQIEKMLEIYDGLENQPEWISRADILDYAERMGVKVSLRTRLRALMDKIKAKVYVINKRREG